MVSGWWLMSIFWPSIRSSPDVGASLDSYGLAVNYDLGGGAVVMAGWGSDVSIAAGDQDQWSIGLGMSF